MNINAMFKISYGLYILTSRDKGKDNGCIINTFSQVTDTPNRVSVTVNKNNYTHDMIKNTGDFNMSVLTEETDFAVFEHFGFQSGRDVAKFVDNQQMPRTENGVVYVPAYTNAYISGKVIQEVDLGTHTMFIADVVDCDIIGDAESLTYSYYHKNVKPKPQQSKAKGYRCRICGYVYEGDELPEDFICPLCKHGAADFEKI